MRRCKVWLSYVNDVDVSMSLIGTQAMFGLVAPPILEKNGKYYHNIAGIVADEPYMDAVGYYIRMNTLLDVPIPILTPDEYMSTIQESIVSKYPCFKRDFNKIRITINGEKLTSKIYISIVSK